jgi:S1-C subfamily serine protease
VTGPWLIGIVTLALGCSSYARTGNRVPLSTKEIVDRAKPAVVRVESESGVGTGFVVGSDGRVVTNLHVIVQAKDITVQLADKRTFRVERVLAMDVDRDLVIVKIDATGLPTVPLGNSDLVSAGERVVVIGNPLGVLDYTVSDGLISAVRQHSAETRVIQTSAPISQGSSGGPLFNNYGEVIGIATFFSTQGQNLNFAIPSNYLRPMLESKLEGISLAEFSERFADLVGEQARAEPSNDGPKVVRNVPHHELAVLEGCTDTQLATVARAILTAIDKGAPIYNAGEHEACFVIYRKTLSEIEGDKAMCKGVRSAVGDGLLRAQSLENFTAKAWALRDTFDGMLDVIKRKLQP